MTGKAALRVVFFMTCVVLASTAVPAIVAESNALDQAIERVLVREAENYKTLQQFTPLVETYIQELKPDREMGFTPISDHYFLGRVSFKGYLRDDSFLGNARQGHFVPRGFAQMAVIDPAGFDRQHYDFKFIMREFLGEVRCLVFDVTPKAKTGKGRFLGRIWVEDLEYNIVRVNGVYTVGSAHPPYVHFDTWRLNLQPGLWLPAYVYSEESDILVGLRKTTFRSQTRLWGYASGQENSREFAQVLVDPNEEVKDLSEHSRFLSPVAAERAWLRQAEDNVLWRLRRAGLLAPPGDMEKLLARVVDNLIITNNVTMASEVRCRVLLTTPIESFTVGHTIVVSRGLLDVIPDEASLAAVLAHELSHVLLDHRLNAKFAYSDRVIFADDQTLWRLNMTRTPAEEQAADNKSAELLLNSPYRDKLTAYGLFTQQLQHSRKQLTNLIRARLGNPLVLDKNAPRLAGLAASTSRLEPTKLDQISALPLGGRISLDPWMGGVEMSKARTGSSNHGARKTGLRVDAGLPQHHANAVWR